MEELKLFSERATDSTEVLFINFGEEEALFCQQLVTELRKLDIKSEVYPDSTKLKKQMDFANKKQIPFVALIGSEELKTGKFTIKEMASGQQESLSRIELLEKFTSNQNIHHGRH